MNKSMILLATSVLILVVSCALLYAAWQLSVSKCAVVDREILFQVSPFNTFAQGNYDGVITYAELAEHGDFGIGTLSGLNGEMIALNGVFYQVPVCGVPRQIGSREEAPYATVTFFDADQTGYVDDAMNYSELTTYISGMLPSENAIYAIKVSGTYEYAKTRSVPLQEKPYPPLTEAVANQTVFTLDNVDATAVGFWFPSSMDGVDYAGYHLHLITDSYDAGGHLLECIVRNVTVEIDETRKFNLVLP
jgi:acetolactate decarboxylase